MLTLAAVIFCGTLLSDYETANATGLEEMMYYTYWDLITSLGYYSGYNAHANESKIQVYKEDDISGEKAWEKFINFFNDAKSFNDFLLAYGLTLNQVAFENAIDELKALPEKVTSDGFSISDNLQQVMDKCFPQAMSYGMSKAVDDTIPVSASMPYGYGQTLNGSISAYTPLVCNAPLLVYGYVASNGWFATNICISDQPFTCTYTYLGSSYTASSYAYHGFYICNNGYGGTSPGSFSVTGGMDLTAYAISSTVWDTKAAENYIDNVLCDTAVPDVVYNDNYDIAKEACPEEIPDVRPLRKDIVIPDEWRVLEKTETGTNPDEDPDKSEDPEKKKNPHVLPVWIPTTPLSPEPGTGTDPDPGTSTDPSTKPDTGIKLDPDAKQDEMIDSNPVGAVIGKAGDFTTLFPFCIPFDIVRLVKGMRAEKAPPVFHFEYTFKPIKYKFVIDVDLSDYEQYVKIFRYGMQIFYVIALMFLTIKVAKLFV